MTSSRRSWLVFFSLGLSTLYWAGWLRGEAVYSGLEANDLWPHASYIELLMEAFHRGSLGLDLWKDQCCLGSAIFRTYQGLPHLLAAAIASLLGISGRGVMHLLLALALATQGLFFYAWARLWRLDRASALSAACLAPLILSGPALGHSPLSYLFGGFGLYTQAIALGPFLLCLGMIGRVTGWVDAGEPGVRDGVALGLLLGVTFLCHEFFGVMAWLVLGIFSVGGLVARWVGFRRWTRAMGIAAGLFSLLTAFQWLSILQDAPLMHPSAWHASSRWDGVGIGALASWLVRGQIFDKGGWPILTVLAVAGIGLAVRPFAPRGHRALLALLLIGVVFYSGRPTFGRLIDLVGLAGAHRLQLERFLALLHLSGILLAATACGALFRRPAHPSRGARAIHWVALLLVISGIEIRWIHVTALLARDAGLTRAQRGADASLDRSLFDAASSELVKGSLWAGSPHDPSLARVGVVPYYAVAEQLGFSQLSVSSHSLTYGSDTLYLFDWRRPVHYRIFGMTAVLQPAGSPVPAFLERVATSGDAALYRAPGLGRWDVVGVPSGEIVEGSRDYLAAVRRWLESPRLSATQAPSIVPRAVASRWPDAVAPASPKGAGEWGEVLSSKRWRSGEYEATLFASRAGGYGLLRTAYHPRWRITVNGGRVTPRWVAPGYVAFSLPQGRSLVKAVFPDDPARGILFVIGLVAFLAGALSLCPGYWPHYRWILLSRGPIPQE